MQNTTIPPTSAGLLSGWYERWTTHRAEKRRKRALRHTRRVLRDLSDSTLRDIGLTRGQIGGFDPANVTLLPR